MYIAISTLNSPRSLGKFILHPFLPQEREHDVDSTQIREIISVLSVVKPVSC